MSPALNILICFSLILAVINGVTCTSSKHTNNWAVLVDSSRYWFNYRHVANTLSMYRSVKRLGIPDSNIILMLADDSACDPRNPRPGTIFNGVKKINVYGDDIEVDYRGYEVTVENFLRVLTGRLDKSISQSKRLLTDENSNILVYMTGHGGDGYLQFQDQTEISDAELADAFQQMWQKKRYNEILFIIDTCQAASMTSLFYSPNIIGIGSSLVGQSSYSYNLDRDIGVHMLDQWTHYSLEYLEKVQPSSHSLLTDMLNFIGRQKRLDSTQYVRTDLFTRDIRQVLVTDFFGSVRNFELMNTSDSYSINVSINKSNENIREDIETEPAHHYRPPLTPDEYFKDYL